MLEIKGLKKSFGKLEVLQGVDLKVDEGSIYGLVGPNGAGKTTMLKIICGLISPDSGTITLDGIDCLKNRKKLNQIVGYVPDFFGIYDNLTVREYMNFFAAGFKLDGLHARKRCSELLELVGLFDKEESLVDTLSRGMQQKLCLARALIYEPKYIVMDEPTNGLDPRSRFDFKSILKNLCIQGKSILISSHILPELSEVCTDIGVIESGKMVISGNILDVLEQIQLSSPLKIKVLENETLAMQILREDDKVDSIIKSENEFLIRYLGDDIEESNLLSKLVNSGVKVVFFSREQGSLESVFMEITNKSKEMVVIQNDY
jgi:hypothetical protein